MATLWRQSYSHSRSRGWGLFRNERDVLAKVKGHSRQLALVTHVEYTSEIKMLTALMLQS